MTNDNYSYYHVSPTPFIKAISGTDKETGKSATSYVLSGKVGKWRGEGRMGRSLDADNPASHEFGHLIGLDDRYKGKEKNYKAWLGNVMGAPANMGSVEQRNIDAILDNSLKEYDGSGNYETFIEESRPSW